MTPVEALSQAVAGLRVGLIMLAVMSLIAGPHIDEESLIDRWRARGGLCLAAAIILYSPAHTAWLLHYHVPPIISRTLDLAATMLTIACLIYLLAGRGLRRGISPERVHRGIIVNIAVVASLAGATWLTR